MKPPPDMPPELAAIEASDEARIQLAWVLAVHAGRETVDDACEAMAIDAAAFAAMTEAALGAAEQGMHDAICEELQQRAEELERQIAVERARTDRALRERSGSRGPPRGARGVGRVRRRRRER